jgi:hypothetical protein
MMEMKDCVEGRCLIDSLLNTKGAQKVWSDYGAAFLVFLRLGTKRPNRAHLKFQTTAAKREKLTLDIRSFSNQNKCWKQGHDSIVGRETEACSPKDAVV